MQQFLQSVPSSYTLINYFIDINFLAIMEPSVNHFVITLPSDSTLKNNAAEYTVKLPYALQLSTDWEVGLWSCSYVHLWNDVAKPPFVSIVDSEGAFAHIRLEDSQYSSIKEVVKTLNRKIITSKIKGFNLKWLSDSFSVQVVVPEDGRIIFNHDLENILGFDSMVVSVTTTGKRVFQLPIIPSIYVYTNLTSAQFVGSIESQLLDIVPVTGKYGEAIRFAPQNISYLPLNNLRPDSVKIILADAEGNNIRFVDGATTVVQLRFKRSLRI
jgi:hypothetical protein